MMIVNTSQRLITFPCGVRENINFVPGIMSDVSKKDWDELKSHPQMKKLMDEGTFVSGTQARKITTDTKKQIESQEEIEAQLDKDLEEEFDEDDK